MTSPRLASTALCVLLLLPGAALAKPGHEPTGERDVAVSSVSRGAGTTRVVEPAPASPGGDAGDADWALPLGIFAAAGCLVLLIILRRRRGDAPAATAA